MMRRRSIEQKRDELAKSHDVSQMHNLTFSDSEAFYDALYAFSSNTNPGWCDTHTRTTPALRGSSAFMRCDMRLTFLPLSHRRILLGYSGDRTLCLQGSGVTIEELVENLKDVEVQYVLFRVPIDAESYKQTHTTRDVFIMWSGKRTCRVFAAMSVFSPRAP